MSQLDFTIYFSQFIPTLIILLIFLYLIKINLISFVKNNSIINEERTLVSRELKFNNFNSDLVKNLFNK
jgi:hypothetical protein